MVFLFLRDQFQKWERRELNRRVFGDMAPEEFAVPRHKKKMRLTEFWMLIDRSRQNSGNINEVAVRLKAELENLQPETIVEFDNTFKGLKNKLYRWDLWGAVYLFNGGCSDDNFEYFRSWLIGQGQQKFDMVVNDPEEIINFAKAGDNWEGLDYCATEVYKRKTGKKFIPGFSVFKESPSGREWTEDDFQVLYPRIWAWLKQNSFQHDL